MIYGNRDQRAIDSDSVTRAEKFKAAHPHVSILWPRQRTDGVDEYLATWVEASADADQDGNSHRVSNPDLGRLMTYLEATFKER
jgi:hypothetical protein